MSKSDARSDQARSWRWMYATTQWRALRRHQLMQQPLCERCLSRGEVMPATVAHHKQAHKGDAVLFFDANNLASSCKPCHDIDEQRIERGGKARQTIGPEGWPV